MATYTVTTAQNIDALASKTGGDIYNVNGGTLTIDQDSRYGTNQNTSATLGAITISATLGGIVNIDGRYVRLIAYTGGSGNVPASNTTISSGSASGLLIGVWSSLTAAPTAAGAAMPATGFIKIKAWNSVAYAAGALTGITATASGADTVGWLDIVGDEAGTFTIPRLGTFNTYGAWYSLGSATGVNTNTYQLPTSGLTIYCPGVWVETSPASGTYEFYANAGSTTAVAANFSTDFRSKVCWVSTTGLVRFKHDGTNILGGFLPASGCDIRVPNVFLQNATTALRTANALPNATLATRFELATTGGAVVNFDGASCGWYLNMNQPFSVTLANTGVFDNITLTECASPAIWNQVGVGQSAALLNFGLTMSLNFAGGTLTDCTFTSASLAASGRYVLSLADVSGFTFVRLKSFAYATRGNTNTGSAVLTRVNSCTFTTPTIGSGRYLMTTCIGITITTPTSFDHQALNTTATNPMSLFDLASSCDNIKIDGLDFGGLYYTQPYNGILNIGAAGCTNIKLRNIGTYASPLSLGAPRRDDQAWTRVTTTATITSTAHGLAVNDTIYAVVSSDVAAIVVGAKTVTAVTANTFTFVCISAGAASGTISFFGTKCGNVFTLAASAAANNVKVQRVYAPHTRTNLFTSDNSSKNVTLENLFSDYLNVPLFAYLNGYTKNVSGTPTLAAQTAVYGTHWMNGYVCDVANNQSAQSWTRSAAVITVTSVGHSLRTGLNIVVNVSSDTTAANLGLKTVTVTSSSTFTITGLAAGAASGTLSYRVLNGRIAIQMNEATADTTSQYTFDAGNPLFTSTGGLYMPVIGDQVTFVSPDYMIGQGSTFPIAEVVMAGGTLTNYDIAYAIDKNDGGGYSAFKNLYYTRAGASGSAAASTFTVTSATGVAVGDYVWGTGVALNAKVTNVVSNTVTVDLPNLSAVSGVLRFNQLPSEVGVDPSLGVKFKVRIKTVATNATAITSLYIHADSTDTGRAYQYPLDPIAASLVLSGLQTDTEVRVYRTADDVEIAGTESSTDSFNYNYSWVGSDVNVYIVVHHVSYLPVRYTAQILGSTGLILPVQQQSDRQYVNPV